MNEYSRTVSDLVAHYLSDGRASSAYEIDCGLCQDFAADLMEALLDLPSVPRACEVWIDDFMAGDPLDDDRGDLDRDRLIERCPAASPPEDLTWADIEVIARDYGFAGGSHVWVDIEGRHYDAETPSGVENPFELPYFLRVFEHFRGRAAAPVPC